MTKYKIVEYQTGLFRVFFKYKGIFQGWREYNVDFTTEDKARSKIEEMIMDEQEKIARKAIKKKLLVKLLKEL